MRLREKALPLLLAGGFSSAEVAVVMAVSSGSISIMARRAGITFEPHNKGRDAEICALYRHGKTQEEIGQQHGITRARVQQVLASNGIDNFSGGAFHKCFVRGVEHHNAIRARWDERTLKTYGCSADVLKEINGGLPRSRAGAPVYRFNEQRINASERGIEWRLTLPEWWRIWKESGKWAKRGRRKNGYVMARIGDSGPYSVENVQIITLSQNSKDGFLVHPGIERAAKVKRAPRPLLSPRQHQASQFIKIGVDHIEAARMWGIKISTAWNYFHSAKRKLAANELVRASA